MNTEPKSSLPVSASSSLPPSPRLPHLATILSQKAGLNLPWVTVREAIADALQARFIELLPHSGGWPCDFSGAKAVKLTTAKAGPPPVKYEVRETAGVYVAEAPLEPGEVQDMADAVPTLLEIAAAADTPIRFHVRVELGSEKNPADKAVVQKIDAELKKIDARMELR